MQAKQPWTKSPTSSARAGSANGAICIRISVGDDVIENRSEPQGRRLIEDLEDAQRFADYLENKPDRYAFWRVVVSSMSLSSRAQVFNTLTALDRASIGPLQCDGTSERRYLALRLSMVR